MTSGKVLAINISEKKGVSKRSIPIGNFIKDFGLEGDAHAGKWHRQVSLMGLESIDKMKKIGLKGLCTGKFAENITTEGIILYKLEVGTRLRVGEILLEISQIGKECHQKCAIYKKMGECIMPTEGVFARVLEGGEVRSGDSIQVVQ